jgi:hypothetical protein
MYILQITFLDNCETEDSAPNDKKAFPDFNLLLISKWLQFWSVGLWAVMDGRTDTEQIEPAGLAK